MIQFQGGLPPGPHAGDISPLTEALRAPLPLSSDQCLAARQMRRAGKSLEVISESMNCSVEDVKLALAAMRTRNRARSRATLNVTLAARDFVLGEALKGEVAWETVDRLLGELTFYRVFATARRQSHRASP